MKLARMIEIITILLNKKIVTANELAERFGVSVRTIYRDIDVLSSSGVPLYTMQGSGGGISIMENYSVNKAILSDTDKNSILFALQTLQSTKYPDVDLVLEKLGSIFKNNTSDWIQIDFTRWGASPDALNRFTDIKNAIINGKVIKIEYINSFNVLSEREVEPLKLIFKSQAWYLWAFCNIKNDYRTFRITRIKKVETTNKTFNRSTARILENEQNVAVQQPDIVHLVLQFSSDVLYRLYDDYNPEDICDNEDGTYTVEIDFPEDEWVYGYIMSFGNHVKVIEPEHIKEVVKQRCDKILEYYK